jgi:peptidoglycan hydrolase-like protein with peptidoglycan-binding domain
LKPDGIVDKETWTALAADPAPDPETLQSNAPILSNAAVPGNPPTVLNKGAVGSKVKTLQVRLEIQGYDPGPDRRHFWRSHCYGCQELSGG